MAEDASSKRDHATHLSVVERSHEAAEPTREFAVIEGRMGLITRMVRAMGTTLLVTFIIGLVGALVLHATIIENQRDLDGQRADITRTLQETEAMRSELAELEAPARIVSEALALGMVEAPSIEYLTASPGQLDERSLTIAANQLLVNE